MSKAIFPGTFDPVTLGHEGLVRRALKIFDAIVIGIGANSEKKTLFSQEQRLAMLKATFADSKNISIEIFEGLTVDFAKKMGATTIIRGIRNGIDLEYEKPISAIKSGNYFMPHTLKLLHLQGQERNQLRKGPAAMPAAPPFNCESGTLAWPVAGT